MVRGLPNNATVNQLKIHFQKKKNAGGSIKEVVISDDEKNSARVTFDDPEGTSGMQMILRVNNVAC